eukprot:126797-Chlamydomonas_euryale.AAC.2
MLAHDLQPLPEASQHVEAQISHQSTFLAHTNLKIQFEKQCCGSLQLAVESTQRNLRPRKLIFSDQAGRCAQFES